MKESLGFGLTRPFQRDLRSDFVTAGGEQLIRSAVGQILGTVGSSDFTQGELPWRTDFGSLLHVLRHQRNAHVLQELARVYVVDALKRWESRVVVTSVQTTREQHDGENVLAIRLQYKSSRRTRRGTTSSFRASREWQLELTPHLEKRMDDRGFNEVDLRAMLEAATGYRQDIVDGRFIIETRHRRADWEVVVEPDEVVHSLVVITAYKVGP